MNTNTEAAAAASAIVAHIETVESELSSTRVALAELEATLAAGPPAERLDTLTMEQVTKALGFGRRTIAEMVRLGEIRPVKIGSRRRIFRAGLDVDIETMRGVV